MSEANVTVSRATLLQLRTALERSLNANVAIQGLCGLINDESWETCADAIYFSTEHPCGSITNGLDALRELIGGDDHG